jgi:hypothetical protein
MTEAAPGLVGVAISIGDLLFGIYVVGAVVALLVIDAPLWPRLGLALLWPLGPLAFVVTISILLAASLIAFPLIGALAIVAALVVALFTFAL